MKRPKLFLRDLFAVVTIVALALGWWLDRSRLAERTADLEAENRRAREDADYWEQRAGEYWKELLLRRPYVVDQP